MLPLPITDGAPLSVRLQNPSPGQSVLFMYKDLITTPSYYRNLSTTHHLSSIFISIFHHLICVYLINQLKDNKFNQKIVITMTFITHKLRNVIHTKYIKQPETIKLRIRKAKIYYIFRRTEK